MGIIHKGNSRGKPKSKRIIISICPEEQLSEMGLSLVNDYMGNRVRVGPGASPYPIGSVVIKPSKLPGQSRALYSSLVDPVITWLFLGERLQSSRFRR